ncbi:MAG: hypothetical protein KJ906_02205 [Nanoarchaeota archaeon]|nr:hypothetical protein [Nanoarchaeota archaeon]
MSKKKIRQTKRKLDEFGQDEHIEIVLRDGTRQRAYFQGIDGFGNTDCLNYTDMVIDSEFSSKVESQTYNIPLHDIGYVQSLESQKKVSTMAFQKFQTY